MAKPKPPRVFSIEEIIEKRRLRAPEDDARRAKWLEEEATRQAAAVAELSDADAALLEMLSRRGLMVVSKPKPGDDSGQ